ncbi:hypothetical protein CGRA01v4_00634 [Colletotrichum graminicola]|nr:hypothetical protein CGRA01v4_00634 [Colletotrichum graminicola]
MRAFILFTPLSLLAGLVTAGPLAQSLQSRESGFLCCNAGVADPSNSCKSKGQNSFCCSGIPADQGSGCDIFPDSFPTGRNVLSAAQEVDCEVNEFTSSCNIGCSSGGAGGGQGFIGCA